MTTGERSPKRRTGVILFVVLAVIALPVRAQKAGQAALRLRKIVFDSNRDGNREIYVMDSDGSHQRRLTQTPGKAKLSWLPAWSPDRTKIAFASNRDGNSEIYIMAADGSQLQRLTNTAGKDKNSWNSAFSPDGKKIAFDSDRDGKWEVYIVDPDGSNLRQLTHTPGEAKESGNPDWSPDGKKIAFASTRDGKSKEWKEAEIYVMHADGANIRRLTHTPGKGNWTPRWSPDGRKIIFSSNRNSRSEQGSEETRIYVMDAESSNVRQLTQDDRPAARPYWSPDGKKVVFVSPTGKSKDWSDSELYVMDADGSNVRSLSVSRAGDSHPAW